MCAHVCDVMEQPQDSIIRSLDPLAFNYTGLSLVWLDFRQAGGNQEYIKQLRMLRETTGLHKFLDQPDEVHKDPVF